MVWRETQSHPRLMSEHTTDIPEIRRLQRSRSDRMLAGVSGGLARYFEIHPAVFRVGFVVLTLLGGAGILIYAAAALVMPDEGKEDSIATAALRNRRDRPWPLIGLGLLAVAVACCRGPRCGPTVTGGGSSCSRAA
jgi:phage shock protein PspC (stress-responsive transcriptional regulator)